MADRRGAKRPLTDEERRDRLAKMVNLGKGKGKAGTSAPPNQNVAPPAAPPARSAPAPPAPATATAATSTSQASRPPGFSREGRQAARPEVRSSRAREDRSAAPPPASRSTRVESRPCPAPIPPSEESSAHRALVTKFSDRLSVEIAEASRRSDPVQATDDGVNKQIEALCIMISGYSAVKGFTNQKTDELKEADGDLRHARRAEKEARTAKEAAEEARKDAENRAKAAEEKAREAEGRQRFLEDWAQKAEQTAEETETSKAEVEKTLRKVERELSSARAEHERYTRVVLPAAIEEARAQAVADFLESAEYNDRVLEMYREGMGDMKAGFTAANPSLVGVDWSFVSAESGKTAAEEASEEGEVTGAARDLIILDDQVAKPKRPAIPEQPAASVELDEPAAAATTEQSLSPSPVKSSPSHLPQECRSTRGSLKRQPSSRVTFRSVFVCFFFFVCCFFIFYFFVFLFLGSGVPNL